MNDTLEVASLFPTPLLKIEIPPELSTACNLFDSTETVSYTHLTLPTKA